MALRHPFPDAVLPDMRRVEEPEKPPTMMKKPREVKFRTGGDMAGIAKEISVHNLVNVCAAVGSGKSTLLPQQLAAETGRMVLHVVPGRLMAVALYDYLAKDPVNKVQLSLAPVEPYAKQGVTLTYSAAVWSMIFTHGFESNPLGDCILYLDEVHESDAYTYSLLNCAHMIPGVHAVVYATATPDVGSRPMRETAGEVESRKFSAKESPAKWDPSDVGKPWSITSFAGNALLFIDSERDAMRLVSLYNMAGATAYRLSAKMSVEAFRAAMKAVFDPRAGIIVLVADYSFRSSFTFDVQTQIDSGLVSYIEVQDGTPRTVNRFAYELERYQAQGRGGRTAGSNCICWYPDLQVQDAICELEGVEIDAAAALFRYAGFAPPVKIRHAKFAKGFLPIRPAEALNGAVPFLCMASDALASFVIEKPVRPATPDDTADLASSYLDQDVEDVRDYFNENLSFSERVGTKDADLTGLDFLHELQRLTASPSVIIPGRYYSCVGMPDRDITSRLYGSDWQAAVYDVQKKPSIVMGMTREDRLELVAMLLLRYNAAVATKGGLNTVLKGKTGLSGAASAYPVQVKEWSEYASKLWREAENTINTVAEALEHLRVKELVFAPMEPMLQLENNVAQEMANRLCATVGAIQAGINSEAVVNRVGMHMKNIMPGPDHDIEDVDIPVLYKSEAAVVTAKPVKLGKRRMVDVTVSAKPGLNWQERDYYDALDVYCGSTSLDVLSIRRLMFDKYGAKKVDAGIVLSKLRERGVGGRRKSRRYSVKSLLGAEEVG